MAPFNHNPLNSLKRRFSRTPTVKGKAPELGPRPDIAAGASTPAPAPTPAALETLDGEYPPPYRAASPRSSTAHAFSSDTKPVPLRPAPGPSSSSSSSEDPYAKLGLFDTVFLIDDSGSMQGANWRATSDALAAVVPVCTAHDADGVDIHFLNHASTHRGIASAGEVMSVFRAVHPSGATPTGKRLDALLRAYLARYRDAARQQRQQQQRRGSAVVLVKPLNIICITDGRPTDPMKLERAIVAAAKELDALGAPAEQVGIQFFQVGCDEAASEALEELDNALAEEEGVRDIVDTVSWRQMSEAQGLSGEWILKVVLGGVDRRLDEKRRFK